MLSTRLAVSFILVALAIGVLFLDPKPTFPLLLVLVLVLAGVTTYEVRRLMPEMTKPLEWVVFAGVFVVVLGNWPAHIWQGNPWHHILGAFAAVLVFAFVVEMALFRGPGYAVTRLALTTWTVAYLGILPSFLVQLRWWSGPVEQTGWIDAGAAAVMLTIFVPKMGDVGAYAVGRTLGRHPMSPVLSPKKTWEGLAGGVAGAAVTALGLHWWFPLLPCYWLALACGVTLGLAGALGDLAASLIKRDYLKKDASQVVPGFGGVLDIVDSILFAAPVAYVWLYCTKQWLGS